jgi:hypothetical protein
MSWEGILKEDEADRVRARSFLKEDIANVIRELEEMEMRMAETDLGGMSTEEMEELSDALGKVSVLLQ